MDERRDSRLVRLCALLLVAATLGAFSAGFRNGWTSADDDILVYENPVQADFGWAELRDAFDPRVPRLHYGSQYTPLSDVSYAIDRKLFGLDPRPYHIQPLVFHAAGALALFALLLRLGAAPLAALFGALVFALHPLQVESVTWIASRRTAMAGSLVLLAALAWARFRTSGSRAAYAASLALALLANLAKQSAVVTAPVLLATEWALRARDSARGVERPREPWPRLLLLYAPHVAITAAFVGIGLGVGAREGVVALRIDPGQRALTMLAALATYARMVAWPADLQPMYRFVLPAGWGDARVVLGAAALLALALAVVALGRRRRAPLAAFGAAVAPLALAPNVHALGTQVIADRYAYLTLAGVAALAAAAAAAGARLQPRAAGALACGLVVALLGATTARVRDWRDDLALFGDAVEADPLHVVHRRLYARALVRAGRLAEAEVQARRAAADAVRLAGGTGGGPAVAEAFVDLAGVCARIGRREEAAAALGAALEAGQQAAASPGSAPSVAPVAPSRAAW